MRGRCRVVVDQLIPSVPDDINGARIGACYNQFTQKLVPQAFAILPSSATADDVIFLHGRGDLTLTANSSSSAAASSTVFRLDTKATGGYDSVAVGVNASVDFHMEAAEASSHKEEDLNVTCYYAFTGQRQELRTMDAHELWSIMTPTFRDKLTAVTKAKDVGSYVDRYLQFVDAFGHGCVTTVHLATGSAFRLTLTRTDDASTLRRKYGGSASLSGHYGGGYGGVSVATDWAHEQQSADASTHVEIVVDNVPEDAPTADWVNGMLSNFTNVAVSALTDKVGLIEPPASVEPVRAPDLPTGVPDKAKEPAPSNVAADDPGISEELQKQLMKDDGFSGSWDEYLTAQKALLASIGPEAVVAESATLAKGAKP